MKEFQELAAKDLWRNLLGVLLFFGVLGLVAYYVDMQTVRSYIERAGVLAPILFVLAKSSTIIIAPLGGAPLYPLSGALFGFWKGALLIVLGDSLGGLVSFLLARIFGRGLVERMIGDGKGLLGRALEMMSTVRGFFIARLCFITFPELASWGAGLTKIGFVPFALIYSLVSIPPALLVSGLGAMIASGGNPFLISFITILTIFGPGLGLLAFLSVIPPQETKESSVTGNPS